MKKIIGLIPSRLGSTRLPRKALLEIDGLPMVIHTAKRAQLSKKLSRVIVCTDSNLIGKECDKYKIEWIITSKKHKNGTERIAEVANKIDSNLIIDIQGDEPFIDPNHIDRLISFHTKHNHFEIVVPYLKSKFYDNKNIVKIVSNKKNKILYFSRSSIPFNFNNKNNYMKKHLSIISFQPKSLSAFKKLRPSNLEKIENIELMRAIENEMSVGTFEMKGSSFAIDVKEDFFKALALMPNDKIRRKY